jgi:hypothetical protein
MPAASSGTFDERAASSSCTTHRPHEPADKGGGGWFGWWASPRAEELTNAWVQAPDQALQLQAAKELGRLAMVDAAAVPFG